MSGIHVCIGKDPAWKCRYNGACYGEICIDPPICSKKRLTAKEKKDVDKFNRRIEHEEKAARKAREKRNAR